MRHYAAILWGGIGAILGAIGDVLILSAARGGAHGPLKLALGTLLYASCGIVWYLIVKIGNGVYSSSAAIWSCVSAIVTMIIALYLQEKQTPLQWIGFGLIIIGVIVRGLSGLIK